MAALAVELSIQGTFLGPLETPAGIVQPTGAKIDVPTADFWYLRHGKVDLVLNEGLHGVRSLGSYDPVIGPPLRTPNPPAIG